MVPTLRKSTHAKTSVSTDSARRAGFVRKPRPSLPRHKLYKRTRGLLSLKTTKALERITIANATNSPLLRLPPEIRNMIFKYAAKTATLVYSENKFAFIRVKAMERWLSNRLPAQCEAIEHLVVSSFGVYDRQVLVNKIRAICPNLRVLREASWMEEYLDGVCSCCRRDFDFPGELSSGDSDGARCLAEMIEEEESDW
ncbi:hypothetical protein EJ02DRAFT_394491 [Clathrospora elynae]|uniref:Uncharacterized protein n=1 Tax=Clathrospora elynae TaxID=706981 RepID=A0A6A5T3L6_9PLEO|nr:hypothetical protein EJ02DRAFT_394491 [Clathrospora elynae]